MDLGYPLPTSVEINGEVYELNLAFDNVLRLIDLLNDERLLNATQINTGLQMLIGTDLPEYSYKDKEEILFQLYRTFIKPEQEEKKNMDVDLLGNPMPVFSKEDEVKEEYFDLKQDAPYIYASFLYDYGIDLYEEQGKLHWYKFKALLHSLSPDSKFIRVIEIRTMKLPEGKGREVEEQRKRIKELKEYYKLK